MSVYNIHGHYGTKTCQIVDIDDTRYRLQLVDDFCRFGGFNDADIAAGKTGCAYVDPSGGPFMSVGGSLNAYHKKLPDKPITKIERNDEGIFLHV